MTVEKLIDSIRKLDEDIRKDVLSNIVLDLRDAGKDGRSAGEADTWAAGWKAAIEFIKANY